jgi:N-acetylglucosaminyldiphosphoundecaprenol N-acetyl-beta-D-mannosaminyltransferase
MIPPRRSSTEPGFINLLGVRVDDLPLERFLQKITETVTQNRRAIVSYANAHALNIAFEQAWFKTFLNSSEVVFCDGFGVWLGGWLTGQQINHRHTPPDWINQLAASGDGQLTFYFLGARSGVAERAGLALKKKVPNCKVVGTHHGYFYKSKSSPENLDVIRRINNAKPNLLLVGFGMPTQEAWIMENWDDLQVNIAMPVGALFDYLAGETPRGPRAMTNYGLEWLGRLIIEPRRLWKRYLIGNPLFIWRIIVYDVIGFPRPD